MILTCTSCFNSRTPGGVRLFFIVASAHYVLVSIHAPREGCDRKGLDRIYHEYVSIHAPREGCDYQSPYGDFRTGSFNSRTPGGVRPHDAYDRPTRPKFQFTHPGRGATNNNSNDNNNGTVSIHAPREGCDKRVGAFIVVTLIVSIHAPREGCDASVSEMERVRMCLNSRTPGGVRRTLPRLAVEVSHVSIHAPREGCDFLL